MTQSNGSKILHIPLPQEPVHFKMPPSDLHTCITAADAPTKKSMPG